MPGTRTRNGGYENALDGTNVTRFLFGDEDSAAGSHANAMDESFPTLVRRDDHMVSYCIFLLLLFPALVLSSTALSPLSRWLSAGVTPPDSW